MDKTALSQWRRQERSRLIAARLAVDAATLEQWRHAIDARIAGGFPQLAHCVLGFCWPVKNEYDPRHLVKALRERGALTALPVVVARGAPMIFREWHPGVRLAIGALDIPYPAESREVVPSAVLLPMNGWDDQGYRLGYGAGFFDRTLAGISPRPLVIGVSFELAHLETIHPQAWDIAMDYVVTERRVLMRTAAGLVALDGAAARA